MGHEFSTAILNCQRENLYSPAVPIGVWVTSPLFVRQTLPLTVGYTQMIAKKKVELVELLKKYTTAIKPHRPNIQPRRSYMKLPCIYILYIYMELHMFNDYIKP